MTKTCTKCGVEKDIEEFYIQRLHYRDCWCKECRKAYIAGWQKRNRERCNAAGRKCYHKDIEASRAKSRVNATASYWRHAEKNRKASAEREKKRRAADPEKARAKERERYRKNPEKKKAAARRWAKKNPEKVREQGRRKWQQNPEKSREYGRKYKARNREQLREANRRRYHKNIEVSRARSRQLAKERYLKNIDLARIKGMIAAHIRRARKRSIPGTYTPEEWMTLVAKYQNRCLCCKRQDLKLTADHVIPVSVPGSTNFITNLQPLCLSCNSSKRTKTIDYRSGFNDDGSPKPN